MLEARPLMLDISLLPIEKELPDKELQERDDEGRL
jgi:hypothetical protein